MKTPVKVSSWIAAFTTWVFLSALVIFTLGSFRDQARLIRDNDNERILNTLFTSAREYDDIASALESNNLLRERITGFAIYGADLLPLFHWGEAPRIFDESLLDSKAAADRNNRFTIADPKKLSVKFVLHWERIAPPLPRAGAPRALPAPQQEPEEIRDARRSQAREYWGGFNPFILGNYYYIDIAHPAYWRTLTLTTIVEPLFILVFLILVLYIRNLYIRNREYRERIEAQKNLVVLGTAASTLAHEIKNPLLSIRLQTGILDKLYSRDGREELSIINEEVDRLSALTYRVNDYIREPKGKPEPVKLRELLAETGERICGRDIVIPGAAPDALVLADPGRLRSVFENLIRNALESGGPPEQIEAAVTRSGGSVTAAVRDRGSGIAEGDLGRVFDPFFTRKSTGTGIGLSISRRFVEAAGGSIVITNREGGGAEARVSFPEYTGCNGGKQDNESADCG